MYLAGEFLPEKLLNKEFTVTSMLVTDVRDEMCLSKHKDVGDGFDKFDPKRRTPTFKRMSPRSKFCHHHSKIVANFKSST